MKKIVIVLIKDGTRLSELLKNIDLNNNKNTYYYNITNETIKNQIETIKESMLIDDEEIKFDAIYLIYGKNNNNEDTIKSIYHGVSSINYRGNIESKIDYITNNKDIIEDFVNCYMINLKTDFEESFITIESNEIFKQRFSSVFIGKYTQQCRKENNYLDLEENLDELAQKNCYCERQFNFLDEDEDRTEFQRDYERITHSKSFMRLVDKAQIFSTTKGDYYKTRMTHTLIVSQIARAIARALRLNLDLVEAIALGHDLGHTPFGHTGERTLHSIIVKDDNSNFNHILPWDLMPKDVKTFGGFKHNYQAIRVLTKLEEQYIQYSGIDLSWQTIEGIWKHTRCKEDKNLEEFINDEYLKQYLYEDKRCSVTLEGQVVEIADEIAQRGHDLEDAFISHLLEYDDFVKYLELKNNNLRDEIRAINIQLETAKKENKIFSNEDELLYSKITSKVICWFIQSVIKYSKEKIKEYKNNNIDDFKENHIITEKLIGMDDKSFVICQYLEKIITNKVINSCEVSRFDTNAEKIISNLFKTYYYNPNLLHKKTVRRIMSDFKQNNLECINLIEGEVNLIRKEWNLIINKDLSNIDLNDIENKELKKVWDKRKILVRNIVDYVAGMTDSYALNEYKELCF